MGKKDAQKSAAFKIGKAHYKLLLEINTGQGWLNEHQIKKNKISFSWHFKY